MDKRTLNYYSHHAEEIFERYNTVEGGISSYFKVAFPKPCRILDIGCGSGRDLRRLLASGHDAYGIEPSDELRNLTVTTFPELRGRVAPGGLPDMSPTVANLPNESPTNTSPTDTSPTVARPPNMSPSPTVANLPFGGNFDAIVCSAVLMHIPPESLRDAISTMKTLLRTDETPPQPGSPEPCRPDSRLLLSIPESRAGISTSRRDDNGRLFCPLTCEHLELLLLEAGFRLKQKWINPDSLNRPGFSWATMLFMRSYP